MISAYHDQSMKISAWARIDNRVELQLLIKDPIIDEGNVAEFIAKAYRTLNKALFELLVGDFSISIEDLDNDEVILARDCFGARPLYYFCPQNQSSSVLYHTNIVKLEEQAIERGFLSSGFKPSEEWMARFILGCAEDWELTAFENVYKVPPSHYLSFSRGQFDKKVKFFGFDASSTTEYLGSEVIVSKYRKFLQLAVDRRLFGGESGNVGCELSGGLDSSSIAAISALSLRRDAEAQLYAFSTVAYPWEGEAISAVLQSSQIASAYVTSTRHIRRMPREKVWQVMGFPSCSPIAERHSLFYKECSRLGISTLLSGHGGDEFTTSEAPVALVEFWRARNMKLFFSRQKGGFLTKPLRTLRWVYQFYRYRNCSVVARKLLNTANQIINAGVVSDQWMQKIDLEKHLHYYFRYDGYKETQNDFAVENRLSPSLSERLEVCSHIGAANNVEFAWPLLDRDLVQFFLSVPSEEKLGPARMGRYLHRRAVAPILPSEIVWAIKQFDQVWWVKLLRELFKRRQKNHALPSVPKKYRVNIKNKYIKVENNIATKKTTTKEATIKKSEFKLHLALVEIVTKKMQLILCTEGIAMDDKSERGRLLLMQQARVLELDAWLKYRDRKESAVTFS